MDPHLVRRLEQPDGARLLSRIGPYAAEGALNLATRLRAEGHDPDLIAAALQQARLRAKAAAGFGDRAAAMFLTVDGLEQATRPELAARHAERYANAGIRVVHDLTCGIGSDAMALAATGIHVEALDADPVAAAVAAANLRPWPAATVRTGRAEQVPLTTLATDRHTGVWLDPARRRPGVTDARGHTRRVFSLDAIAPSWADVRRIAERVPATGVKLSPAFPHAARPEAAEAQWTSWRGELLECVVWWGPLVAAAGRTAAVCRPGSPAAVVTEDDAPATAPVLTGLGDLGAWLYEADRAVVQARLTAALVASTDGSELAPGVGLVGSATRLESPIARRYAVAEAMPLHVKALRAWLRERGIGRVTVKKRGCRIDPDQLRSQVATTKASGSALLLVTTVAGDTVVLVLEEAG